MAEALELWLQARRLAALRQAYRGLGQLEGGDLEAAGQDAVAMGSEALDGEAVPLPGTSGTGLQQPSYAMAWHPTTVLREQLRSMLAALRTALDLDMLEPWQEGE